MLHLAGVMLSPNVAARTLAEHSVILLAVIVVLVIAAVVVTIAGLRAARRRRMAPSHAAVHLVLGSIGVAAMISFLILGRQVRAGSELATFDDALSSAIVETTSREWQGVFSALTWFGSALPLGVAAGIVGLILIVRRHYAAAAWWLIAQVGAGALVLTLKATFARPRPEFAYATELARGWSFPSGHALRTFVFCALGAYLLLRFTRPRPAWTVLAACGIAFGIVVAFTRVYLGAHFLTDVVGGLIAATALVVVCVSGIEISLRRERKRALDAQ